MANYPVDPTNPAEPTNARAAGYAAEELRAIKGYLQTLVPSNANRSRNRFCNGAFTFDQRGLGAAFTINSAAETRTLDCFVGTGRVAGGAFTVQQLSTGGPVGSPTFVRCTVATADAAIPSGAAYWTRALLEGRNTDDLGWGAAGALPVSIGFWFRSSITGTFSGSVQNANATRSYPVSWTYPIANVWQFITLPNIPGDITGTWPTTNVRSMNINFCLGAGTAAVGPADVWAAAGHLGVTGTTNLMATLGATFDMALLQFEAGTACTPFEWTPISVGLARVRRYLQTNAYIIRSEAVVTGSIQQWIPFDTPMRTTPTMSLPNVSYTNANSGNWFNANSFGAELNCTVTSVGGFMIISGLVAGAEL